MKSGRVIAAVAVLCLLLGGYLAFAALGSEETSGDSQPGRAQSATPVMVRAVDPSNPTSNGDVFVVEDGKEMERSGELACQRVYYAGGRGICMGVAPSGVEYTAAIFDSKLQVLQTIPLTGLPSRARVSADGRLGAMTLFVGGDSYVESATDFSTRTSIIEMATGKTVASLEQFDVIKDGKPFDAADFNFWGVTFAADPNRFYATLATGRHHYLVEGDLAARSLRVLRDGVECPSLSPDGKQIAFKSRVGKGDDWRLHVLDLATLADHPTAETRSVDDQAEWLDDGTLAYSDGENVYTVPADGSGEEQVRLESALGGA
jgi:dipeptidyl aminopeptidase/acylaminoacyl peptidase